MQDDLRRRWQDLVGTLGVDDAEATRVLRELWRRHDEPHRAYHTLSHVRHVLDVVDFIREREPVADILAVRLATWFHDAVYDPTAADSEERSADLAGEVLTGWELPGERIRDVRELVLATKDHLATTGDAAVLCDADLAILAADPDTYDVYRRGVRVEYRHLDDATWRAARAALLERLLDRDALFATPTMRARGEAAARRNLIAELDDLLELEP